MKHIDHFNKSIKGLLRQTPSDSTLLTIENYREELNYKDYYEALDSLGLKLASKALSSKYATKTPMK